MAAGEDERENLSPFDHLVGDEDGGRHGEADRFELLGLAGEEVYSLRWRQGFAIKFPVSTRVMAFSVTAHVQPQMPSMEILKARVAAFWFAASLFLGVPSPSV
jgi:hypothetical protein